MTRERKELKESKLTTSTDTQDHQQHKTNSNDNELCSICQEKFDVEEKIQTLQCGHKFHEPCIQKWIEVRNLCPLCKQVADNTRPVTELSSDDEHLTLELIERLLGTAHNSSSLHFWQDMMRTTSSIAQYGPVGSMVRVIMNDNRSRSHPPGRSNQSGQLSDMMNMVTAILGPSHPRVSSQPLHPQPTHPQPPPSLQVQNVSLSSFPDFDERVQHLRYQRFHDPDLCDEQAQCSNCAVISCKHAILRCSQCRQIRYCSRDCQNQHWNQHKDWCMQHAE